MPDAARAIKPLAFVIAVLLVADLFGYRGVPSARSIAAGRINVDWLNAFGAVGRLRPAAHATSYLLNVWHATMIGILMSGLTLTVLTRWLGRYFMLDGFRGSVLGALFALPQPLCSCCSSIPSTSFVRRGSPTNFSLSFVVGALMLNVTTIILAIALLPVKFAITRIVAGLLIAVFVTYLVVRLVERPSDATVVLQASNFRLPPFLGRLFGVFDVERLIRARRVGTPSQMIAAWLREHVVTVILVPALWIWSVVASLLFQAMPSAFGNNLASVVVAAVAGTFFMISKWSEIPMALALIRSGFTGPAAALLVVLPAISLPCMVLLGGSLRRFRLVAALSAAVMLVGVAAGAMFL